MVSLDALRSLLDRLYIDAPGARLRREDEKKCLELRGLLHEIASVLGHVSKRAGPLRIVDAAAGKGYVGLSVAALLVPSLARQVEVTFFEREPERAAAIDRARRLLGLGEDRARVVCSDVGDTSVWPQSPHLAVALHACGDATDRTMASAMARGSRYVLVVPCCVAGWLPAAVRARQIADEAGLPDLAEVRRRHLEAWVLGHRVWTLEAAGWQTEAVAFVPPSVTPYNVLLRARRVGEPRRMQRAAAHMVEGRVEPQGPLGS